MDSVWEKTASFPSFSSLEGERKCDVLVIGGGICGILCAYMLRQSGVDAVLVEANSLCSGITKNTTAKITVAHGLIYDKLINTYGVDKAREYLVSQMSALEKYRELCKRVECHFEEKDAYVYSLSAQKKIENEISALKKLGLECELTKNVSLPFKIAGAVKYSAQAQFNPLEFLLSLLDNLEIYEHTAIKKLDGNTAISDKGKIVANKIIVATHFPFINKHGLYFLKMYQHRSYVIALENAQRLNGMYVDEDKRGLSFRNYENLLLLGGGAHRTGKNGGGWDELRGFAQKYYPKSRELTHYATQDCMSLDSVPYIGKYSSCTDNLYVATGFNKWGMSSSMVASKLLCDLILGKKNTYANVYSPNRSILHPRLLENALESVLNLIRPSSRRCTHLGCRLVWNKNERSWDCPCHGSRFEENGALINNPAMKDL